MIKCIRNKQKDGDIKKRPSKIIYRLTVHIAVTTDDFVLVIKNFEMKLNLDGKSEMKLEISILSN